MLKYISKYGLIKYIFIENIHWLCHENGALFLTIPKNVLLIDKIKSVHKKLHSKIVTTHLNLNEQKFYDVELSPVECE